MGCRGSKSFKVELEPPSQLLLRARKLLSQQTESTGDNVKPLKDLTYTDDDLTAILELCTAYHKLLLVSLLATPTRPPPPPTRARLRTHTHQDKRAAGDEKALVVGCTAAAGYDFAPTYPNPNPT